TVAQSLTGTFFVPTAAHHLNGQTSWFVHYDPHWTTEFLTQGPDPFVAYLNIDHGSFRLLYAADSVDYQWIVSIPPWLPLAITFLAGATFIAQRLWRPSSLCGSPTTASTFALTWALAAVAVTLANITLRTLELFLSVRIDNAAFV